MAKYVTDFNSISCGGKEFFAADGAVEIPDEFASLVADFVACGDLMLASDAAAVEESAPADKPKRGRR